MIGFTSILYIDFFIKYNDKKYFIEYNGKQRRRNQLLRDFCNLYQDKVSLLEISYKKPEENIENIILNFINYDVN